MKKQLIILVVCIVVAGALGAAVWFLLGYEPGGDEAPSSSAVSTAVQLVEKTSDDLDTLSVENAAGSFVIKNAGGGDYAVEGIEGVAFNKSSLQSAAGSGYSLRADSVIAEAPDDLAAYGLDDPAVRLTAKFVDGSEFSLEIGDKAPAGSVYYCKKAGEDTVYTVSEYNVRNLMNDRLDFISREVTSAPASASAQNGQVLPESVTLGGSMRRDEIRMQKVQEKTETEQQYNLNTYEMTAPKARGVDSDKGVQAISGLLTITADKVAAYQPDETALAAFGLREPYSTIRFTYLDDEQAEQTVELRVSAKDADGNVYLTRTGVPLVYQLAATGLPWYEMGYADFVSSLQLLPFIDTVGTMRVSVGGRETVFALSGDGDEMTVMSGGKQLDTDMFRKFYQNLIGVPSEEYTEDAPPAEDTAVLRVTYEYRDGSPSDTMALLPSQQPRKVFLSVNGEAEFYTKASYADTISANMEKLLAGEKVGDLY